MKIDEYQNNLHMRLQISFLLFIGILSIVALNSCRDSRIHEQREMGEVFKKYGIADACFILRDHSHDEVYLYNKVRCLERFSPASTFKIFNSLVALETAVAPDEQLIIKWDSVVRDRPELNKDMNMRDAFKWSNVSYYQELARRIGKDYMQHYIDTAQYGNRYIGNQIDAFWLNDSLQISADEQVGLMRRLYFDELPFSERSQRIVRSMMTVEESDQHKIYYKTGTKAVNDSLLCWVVGYAENIVNVQEPEKSMNKSNVRSYPYFFAMNFTVPNDANKDWFAIRMQVLRALLNQVAFTNR